MTDTVDLVCGALDGSGSTPEDPAVESLEQSFAHMVADVGAKAEAPSPL